MRPCSLLNVRYCNSAEEGVVKHRTYDPDTKTLKKHATDGDVEMDTVEKNIEGLAEQIIEEDAERRAQELLWHFTHIVDVPPLHLCYQI